jgi:hypothetical protein
MARQAASFCFREVLHMLKNSGWKRGVRGFPRARHRPRRKGAVDRRGEREPQRPVRLGSRNVLSDFRLPGQRSQQSFMLVTGWHHHLHHRLYQARGPFHTVMTTFTYWKGVADVATGVVLLTKPEIIYHSVVAKFLNQISGLRLPNAHPTAEGEVSSQHAVAIMVRRLHSCALQY